MHIKSNTVHAAPTCANKSQQRTHLRNYLKKKTNNNFLDIILNCPYRYLKNTRGMGDIGENQGESSGTSVSLLASLQKSENVEKKHNIIPSWCFGEAQTTSSCDKCKCLCHKIPSLDTWNISSILKYILYFSPREVQWLSYWWSLFIISRKSNPAWRSLRS